MIEAILFAAAAVIALYLLAPAFRRTAVPAADPRAALQAARSVALRALHDLDLDWETGKLSDDDYRAQRAALEAEAAAIGRQLAGQGPVMPS